MQKTSSFLTDLECDSAYDNANDVHLYLNDPICGSYAISYYLQEKLKLNPLTKDQITFMLTQKRVRGIKTNVWLLDFDPKDLPPLPIDYLTWKFESIDSLLANYPRSPLKIFDESLYNIALLAQHPSDRILLDNGRKWLLYPSSDSSLTYILQEFIESNLLKACGKNLFQVTTKGWQHLSAFQRSIKSEQAFVAMWFDPTMDNYFSHGIKAAIEATKRFTCFRIDQKEHSNKICDEIIAEIRRSRFVVADFSGSRGGVYFEAGFAYGLGLPVIWTVHEDHLEKLHFDTRQYNHITYKAPEELKNKLLNRIGATII